MQTFAPRGNIVGPILPQFVLETSISFGAKITYALLCNYASENDHCWPSQAKLAEHLSCSLNSVKKYLSELVEARLILVQRKHYRSSVYYMLRPENLHNTCHESTPVPLEVKPDCSQPIFDSCQSISASDQPISAYPPSEIGYSNNLNKQEENTKSPLPPVPPAQPEGVLAPTLPVLGGGGSFLRDFEKAWTLYPKQEAKGLARAAWLHLARSGQLPEIAEIEVSIRHFRNTVHWQREQGRFVPQMGNWLKGQRWLDAPAVTQEVPNSEASFAQVVQVQHEADQATRTGELEVLRPAFAVFAARFHEQEKPWSMPMAFGLWAHLHGKNMAPTPADVSDDNSLGIVEFLQAFKRQCEDATWLGSRASKPALHTVFGVPAGQYAGTATPRNDIPLYHPPFAQMASQEVLGRAV